MHPSIDPKEFGQFIARHRDARGLSQATLAKAAGISRPYLTQIENGRRRPSPEVLQRLLVLVGASMQQFIDDVVGASVTDEEAGALTTLLSTYDKLAEHVAPEQMLGLLESATSLQDMAQAMGKLSHMEVITGPEGWEDLSKEDRRLVQRLVNRLRSAATGR